MFIDIRYLEEIRDICDFKFVDDGNEVSIFRHVIYEHWNMPSYHGGIFDRCRPTESEYECGCLTQIKDPQLDYEGILDCEGDVLRELTIELENDERIAENWVNILPEHLSYLSVDTPLTEEQRAEVMAILLPYAEWQTRLRIQYREPVLLQEV